MIRFRIQLSRVSILMAVFVLSGIAALTPASVHAQACTGALASVTYDTVVTESSSGGGNATGGFSYTIPKFNVPLGTLYAAVVKSNVITASVNATMINFTGSTGSPSVTLYRTDGVTSTAIPNGSGLYLSPA